jgi:SPP1 gp7 family putative phage head morphogenesis protein
VALSKQRKTAIKKELDRRKTKQLSGTGVDVPLPLEAYYYRQLLRVVRAINNGVVNHVTTMLTSELMQDAKDPLISAVDRLQKRMAFTRLATEIASDVVGKGDTFNRKAFIRLIKKDIGVDVTNILKEEGLKKLLDKRIQDNVDLIKTIPQEYFARIRVAIKQGRRKDDTAFSIKKDLQSIFKITKNRAKLIARDQVSKTNAALNEFRQEDIGVTEYTWRTSGDERVRDDHKANNGKKFKWNRPPSKTGHPGHDVQCRCTADPDFGYLKRL